MSQTPRSVLAVDAFGLEAVQQVCPDWEGRHELSSKELFEAASHSKFRFATDGKSVLPGGYLAVSPEKLGAKLTPLKAVDALNIFGLTALADVGERGVAIVTPEAAQRLESFATAKKPKEAAKSPFRTKMEAVDISPLKGRSQPSLRDKILKVMSDYHELTLTDLTKLVGVKQASVKPVIDTLVKNKNIEKASASRYVLIEGLSKGARTRPKVHA